MLPKFRSFAVRANVTAARRDNLNERLEDIRRELGEECFALVMAANEADVELYEKIRQGYARAAES